VLVIVTVILDRHICSLSMGKRTGPSSLCNRYDPRYAHHLTTMCLEVARVKIHEHQRVLAVLLVIGGCNYELTTSLLAESLASTFRYHFLRMMRRSIGPRASTSAGITISSGIYVLTSRMSHRDKALGSTKLKGWKVGPWHSLTTIGSDTAITSHHDRYKRHEL
jgi:hypothetical protein